MWAVQPEPAGLVCTVGYSAGCGGFRPSLKSSCVLSPNMVERALARMGCLLGFLFLCSGRFRKIKTWGRHIDLAWLTYRGACKVGYRSLIRLNSRFDVFGIRLQTYPSYEGFRLCLLSTRFALSRCRKEQVLQRFLGRHTSHLALFVPGI